MKRMIALDGAQGEGGIFTAFHMRGGTNLVFHTEQFFRFSTAHYPPGTVVCVKG